MTDKELIKQEIESYKESMKGLEPHSDFRRGQITAYNQIMQFIDSIPEEPANEDLEIEIENYINSNFSEGCDGGMLSDSEPNLGGVTYCDLANLARRFAEWQKQKDESRRKANIALANTDIPKDKDLEIAFEDIWSDVENCVSDLNKLSNEQKYKLKNAHHDTFEAGAEWQKQKDLQDFLEKAMEYFKGKPIHHFWVEDFKNYMEDKQ